MSVGSINNGAAAIIPIEQEDQASSCCSRAITTIQEKASDIRCSEAYKKAALQVPIIVESGKAFVNTIKSKTFMFTWQWLNNAFGRSSGPDISKNPKIIKLCGTIRLFVLVATVIAVYNIVAEAIEIKAEIAKKRWTEGTNAVLRMVDAVSTITDTVASFAMGLAMIKVVKAAQILWATPLAMVGAGLSVVSLALEWRGMKQSKEIQNRLQGPDDVDAYDNIVTKKQLDEINRLPVPESVRRQDRALTWLRAELIDSENRDGEFYLRRHFEIINREQYGSQILAIIDQKANLEVEILPVRQGKKMDLLKALQERISDKIWSHRVAIISVIVSLIGAALIFCGPLSFGLGFVVGGAFLGLARFITDRRSVGKLEKTIDTLCPFDPKPGSAMAQFINQPKSPAAFARRLVANAALEQERNERRAARQVVVRPAPIPTKAEIKPLINATK